MASSQAIVEVGRRSNRVGGSGGRSDAQQSHGLKLGGSQWLGQDVGEVPSRGDVTYSADAVAHAFGSVFVTNIDMFSAAATGYGADCLREQS